MNQLKNLFKEKKTFGEIVKYVFLSGITYVFVFVAMYIAVDLLEINESLSFAIVYAIAYIFVFISQLRYIFEREYEHKVLFKFIIHIIFFYLLNNLVFYLLNDVLQLNYLVALVINIMILFPLRFLSSKFFVFRGEDTLKKEN